ncbi:hypothetical protein K461DRAFT_246077 [Myriangium duriaei CBS 260.36]|uniref:Zn(2)-C6 fungal-type domain-containing protein n=1 Tax=Myriangium duriaei CBS 260.36 TaxID=1168546 RepID=A0A9P4IYW4_9PEZI|nr:hypothetical protein K461DRAFT_246077 [Myriangium duriaei CBS 260.36]
MPRVLRKLPACEPCRNAKLACDHAHPVCRRCHERDSAAECMYRASPFKKRRKQTPSGNTPGDRGHSQCPGPAVLTGVPSPPQSVTRSPQTYPNPGYLGSSSHTRLFGNVPSIEQSPDSTGCKTLADRRVNETNLSHGVKILEQIFTSIDVAYCVDLVRRWMDKGTNLALAEPFTTSCIETVEHLLRQPQSQERLRDLSGKLYQHSLTHLTSDLGAAATIHDLNLVFSHENARWETLGLFFTSVSRAKEDESDKSSLSNDVKLQRIAMEIADKCLEIALSLDCLNHLQVVFQYENYINHTIVDGDQSLNAYNRLGCVISSLFALGYHRQNENEMNGPDFLVELKQAVFARCYSADKNVSIFLGRPPRMSKRYCQFRPLSQGKSIFYSRTLSSWTETTAFSYMTDTWWAALCSVLKEDIQELSTIEDPGARSRQGATLQAQAEANWVAFPEHLRLEGQLMAFHRHPLQLDFMVSARLNHLHVLYLLRSALANRRPETDVTLVAISAEMVALTVEAILHRQHLINSGTSLVWKVAYYGLAAAGVLYMWLISDVCAAANQDTNVAKVIRDLNVLVAATDAGTLVGAGDPNYRLLTSATSAIGSLLDRLATKSVSSACMNTETNPDIFPTFLDTDTLDNGQSGLFGMHDFDADFWFNLEESPVLQL